MSEQKILDLLKSNQLTKAKLLIESLLKSEKKKCYICILLWSHFS